MNPAGLILAAGESRRMGVPKALLEFGGETFLDGLIRAFSTHCAPVIAVLGADAERVRAGLRAAHLARIEINPDYMQGQFSSMQCGLRAVPPGAGGVLFTLVDHPRVRQDTLLQLLAGPGPIAIPRYQGRRGHPIYFSRELIPEFLALDAGSTARPVLERLAAEIRYLDVDDPGILDDVDDPESYRRFLREHGAQS